MKKTFAVVFMSVFALAQFALAADKPVTTSTNDVTAPASVKKFKKKGKKHSGGKKAHKRKHAKAAPPAEAPVTEAPAAAPAGAAVPTNP